MHLGQSADMSQRLIAKRAWSREIDCHILAFYSFKADVAYSKNLSIAIGRVIIMIMGICKHMLAFIQVKKMILNCFGFIGSIIIHQFNTIHIHFTIVVASIRVECEIVLYSCTSLSSKLNCNGGR